MILSFHGYSMQLPLKVLFSHIFTTTAAAAARQAGRQAWSVVTIFNVQLCSLIIQCLVLSSKQQLFKAKQSESIGSFSELYSFEQHGSPKRNREARLSCQQQRKKESRREKNIGDLATFCQEVMGYMNQFQTIQ